MTGPVARILLRYAAAALVTWGFLSPQLGGQIAVDRDLIAVTEVGIGLAVGAAVEVYYWVAKRWGWST